MADKKKLLLYSAFYHREKGKEILFWMWTTSLIRRMEDCYYVTMNILYWQMSSKTKINS